MLEKTLDRGINMQKNCVEPFVVCFKNFDASMEFEKALRNLIEQNDYICVADVINLFGGYTSPSDRKYGWLNLAWDDVGSGYINNNHLFELPIPHYLGYSEQYKHNTRRPKRGGKHPCSSTVNHPNHYQSETGLEVIDVIDAFTDGLDGVEAFDTGNIIKYICRWKKKNGIEDLEKAKWYLENLIKEVKEKENEDAK